jgi:hypothetical protein
VPEKSALARTGREGEGKAGGAKKGEAKAAKRTAVAPPEIQDRDRAVKVGEKRKR